MAQWRLYRKRRVSGLKRPRAKGFAVEVEEIEQEKNESAAVTCVRCVLDQAERGRAVGPHTAQLPVEIALSGLFDPNMQFPDWPGSHPAVQCQFWPALISWVLGYPDRSLEELRAAVRSAE